MKTGVRYAIMKFKKEDSIYNSKVRTRRKFKFAPYKSLKMNKLLCYCKTKKPKVNVMVFQKAQEQNAS